MELNDKYWTDRYQNRETGWDIGEVSTPIKEYIDQLKNKTIRILVPGCGNAYEAAYLVDMGFQDITLIDISEAKSNELAKKFVKNPCVKVLHGDFFNHTGNYDLIIEQTFFCALDPTLREAYVEKMHSLLSDGGKLAGVLFNRDFNGGRLHLEDPKMNMTNYSPGSFISIQWSPVIIQLLQGRIQNCFSPS